jgi:hypothetical protein
VARRCPTPDEARGDPYAAPEDLLGYADPSEQPEATGVEKLVLKRGNLFLVANRLGDVAPAGARDLGLFLGDTRHLSAWRLSVAGGPPLCLSSQVSTDYMSQIDFTITGLHVGDLLGKEPVNYVHLRRDGLVDDVLLDRLVLTNFQGRPIEQRLELSWAADFADVFEIRGARRARRGRHLWPEVGVRRVVLRYQGLDGRTYFTEIELELLGFDGAGARATLERLDGRAARVALRLEPGCSGELVASAFAGVDGARRRARRERLYRRVSADAPQTATASCGSRAAWRRAVSPPSTSRTRQARTEARRAGRIPAASRPNCSARQYRRPAPEDKRRACRRMWRRRSCGRGRRARDRQRGELPCSAPRPRRTAAPRSTRFWVLEIALPFRLAVIGSGLSGQARSNKQPLAPYPGLPDFESPDLAPPALVSPGLVSPGLASPGLASPGLASPGLAVPAASGAATT